MGSRSLALALGGLALAAVPAAPAQPPAAEARPPIRVALALSGGGARGVAHIGALRALEEAGIPVDAIAANSMGAVVGGIYATGRGAAELETVVRSMDWASLFSGRPDRRTLPVDRRVDRHGPTAGVSADWKGVRLSGGLIGEHRVNRFLIEHLSPAGYAAGRDFDRLPIPFRAVATDLDTGDLVLLERGDLARAVRASMSIPLVFAPVAWEGRTLVDGMVASNLPIHVARRFGAWVTVAVDAGSPPLEPSDYDSALGVASRVNDLLMRRRHRDFPGDADVLVRPDLGRHSAADYSGFDDLIRRGYEATKAQVPAIRARLEEAGAADLWPRRAIPAGPPLEGAAIRSVAVDGNDRVADRLVRRAFNVPIGPPYEMARGLRAFDKLDASGLLERTWLDFEPDGDGVRIVVRVKDASPNRAEVGIAFSEAERARGSIRLRNQNTFGFGEQVELLLAASDAETLRQVSLRGDRLFVAGLGYRAAASFSSDKPRFFDAEGDEINRANFEREWFEAALRTPLERWGLLEAGARFGRVKTHAEPGIDLPDASDQVGTLFATVAVDTLDALAWPERGRRLAIRGEWSLPGLGASLRSWRVDARARLGEPLGDRLTLQLDGLAALGDEALPVYDWHRVGGPELVPGYRHEQIKGACALAGALSLRFTVAGQLRVLARTGAGNAFARRADMTLDGLRWGVGAGLYHPSPIGPVAFELGVRDDGSTLASLAVGWP